MDGREVLTTNYNAGQRYCPAYQKHRKYTSGLVNKFHTRLAIEKECETGKVVTSVSPEGWAEIGKEPILPDTLNVIECLVVDTEILDYPNFEEWASTFGFEEDLRSACKIYEDCLKTALKLRGGIGADVLNELKHAIEKDNE